MLIMLGRLLNAAGSIDEMLLFVSTLVLLLRFGNIQTLR
jgi:hypothetical protein